MKMAIVSGQKAASYVRRVADIVGIILAGGESSRMGQNKVELIYQGCSFLQRAQALMKLAGVKKTYISGPGHIKDIITSRGPLGGIYSVMQNLPDDQEVLILPIDMPLLSKELLSNLLKKVSKAEVVHFEKFMLPLKLKLSKSVKKYITEVVKNNTKNASFRALFSCFKSENIKFLQEDLPFFSNINTPQELEIIKKGDRE